ncbi:MAG: DUF3971 domain-containing protein [Alphaproteobacteria bacterium]
MIQRGVRTASRVFGALGLAVFVLVPLIAWRISTAPLSLAFLSPYLQDALTPPDRSYAVTLENTELWWATHRYSLEMRAIGVKVTRPDGHVIAGVPTLALGLSLRALAKGMIAPSWIEIRDSRLHLVRRPDGSLKLDLGLPETAETPSVAGPFVTEVGRELLGPLDTTRAGGYLRRVSLTGARLVLEDYARDGVWPAANLDLEVTRGNLDIAGKGRLSLDTTAGLVRLEFAARHLIGEAQFSAGVRFADLQPAAIAALVPVLDPLSHATTPLSGRAEARIGTEGNIRHVDFDISAGPGQVRFPAPHTARYEFRQARAIGEIASEEPEGKLSRLVLHSFDADLGGPKLHLTAEAGRRQVLPVPAPEVTVANVAAPPPEKVEQRKKNRRSDKTRAVAPRLPPPPLPVFGPPIPVEGVFLKGDAVLAEVPVDSLDAYWPQSLSPKPRAWVTTHLSIGTVPTARFSAELQGTSLETLALQSLDGVLAVRNATVDYLPPMPPLRGVNAKVVFAPTRIDITSKEGRALGLRLAEASVALLNLEKEDQDAEISLVAVGPVNDALRLVDSKPLGYATALGIKPAQASGQSETRLKLAFPLLVSLTLDRVQVHADSKLQNLALKEAAFGRDLTDGLMRLRVTTSGLEATGTAALAGTPIQLTWRENFSAKVEPRSHYGINGRIEDAGRRSLGFDFPPLAREYLQGPVPIDLTAEISHDGHGKLSVRADLTPAVFTLPPLNWTKPKAVPAMADVEGRFLRDRFQELTRFTVTGGRTIDVRGRLSLDENGRLKRLEFQRLKLDRTDLHATVTAEAGGLLAVQASGPAFDAKPLLAATPEEEKRTPPPEGPPLRIDLSTERLWVSEPGFLADAKAHLSRSGPRWEHILIDATSPKSFRIRLEPKSETTGSKAEGILSVTSTDAGDVLRTFDLFDNVTNGTLEVNATTDVEGNLTGQATLADYRVIRAPALARLLTLAALTGIVESLTGDGLRFTTLDLPFSWIGDHIRITEARAYGPSLGLTAKGLVMPGRGSVNLQGTIVPMYALNSLPGRLPLLGDLLVAEKGGGLIAATYTATGSTAAPDISVNPLALLTPGLVRRFLGLFASEPTDAPLPEKK